MNIYISQIIHFVFDIVCCRRLLNVSERLNGTDVYRNYACFID